MDAGSRVAEVQGRIAAAAARAGRSAADVTLVAAAKTRTAEQVAEVIAAGVRQIGHNYVQEAQAMRPELPAPAAWRLIGHLQRNKAKDALALFDVIDSLDSERLAKALDRQAAEAGREVPVLLQVRLGGEETKSGVEPAAVEPFLEVVQQTAHLRCLGLMTMPPPASADESRRWFGQLRELAERLRAHSGLPLRELSMGMSGDYEVAIEEGATLVRVGTALFGPRIQPARRTDGRG